MASLTIPNKNKRIHIMFRWNGEQHKLASPFYCEKKGINDCTCKGCHNARLMAKTIQEDINRGKFSVAEFFPEYAKGTALCLPTDTILFTEYMHKYIEDKKLAPSSSQSYKSISNILVPHFKGLLLQDITKAHIKRLRDYLAKQGYANKTINNRLTFLSGIFNDAIDAEIIAKNPVTGVYLKNNKVKIIPFTPTESRQILDTIDEHRPDITLFFAIGFYTGMRTGEILALNKEDIDLINHKIYVTKTITIGKFKNSTKTDEDREVDIVEHLDSYIEKHFQLMKQQTNNPEGYLFVSQSKNRIVSCSTISKYYWKPALKKLELVYRQPYHMRHTFACQNIAAGEDLNWIKDMLGHETLEMLLKTYGKWLIKREGRAGSKLKAYIDKSTEGEGI